MLMQNFMDTDVYVEESQFKGTEKQLTVDAIENRKSYLLRCFFVHLPCGAISPKNSVYSEKKRKSIKRWKQIEFLNF
jgi:hypothetical protein